jgi:hypothetical protein
MNESERVPAVPALPPPAAQDEAVVEPVDPAAYPTAPPLLGTPLLGTPPLGPPPLGPPPSGTHQPTGFGYAPPQGAPAAPGADAQPAGRPLVGPGYPPAPQNLPVGYYPAQLPVHVGPMKETGIAYLFLILLGGVGAHEFYLGKTGRGILYILTLGGFLGILPLIDLFTLPSQVRRVNTERAVLGR